MESESKHRAITLVRSLLKDRAESHGINHALTVHRNAMEIFRASKYACNTSYAHIIELAALFHDVCDHKYNTQENLNSHRANLCLFLNEESKRLKMNDLRYAVLAVIREISYSRECTCLQKGELPSWYDLPEHLQFCRHVVSDADKIEALGAIGIVRCILYQKETTTYSTKDHEIDVHSVALNHMKDKLLKMTPHFIRTDYGLRIARRRHEMMKKWVREFDKCS